MKHSLVGLTSVGEKWDRRAWAQWECSCGVRESGYRFALMPGGAACGAANEWADHVVRASIHEAVYSTPHI